MRDVDLYGVLLFNIGSVLFTTSGYYSCTIED